MDNGKKYILFSLEPGLANTKFLLYCSEGLCGNVSHTSIVTLYSAMNLCIAFYSVSHPTVLLSLTPFSGYHFSKQLPQYHPFLPALLSTDTISKHLSFLRILINNEIQIGTNYETRVHSFYKLTYAVSLRRLDFFQAYEILPKKWPLHK